MIRFIDEKGEEHYIELAPVKLIHSQTGKIVELPPQRTLEFDCGGRKHWAVLTSCGDDEYHYLLDGKCWHTRQFSERMAENGTKLVQICPIQGKKDA